MPVQNTSENATRLVLSHWYTIIRCADHLTSRSLCSGRLTCGGGDDDAFFFFFALRFAQARA